jgi:IS30 family transposase
MIYGHVVVDRPRGKQNLQYKANEREVFFRRLNRGGTIHAVAAELGLSVDACYRWRREAHLSTPRVKNRSYSALDCGRESQRVGW